MDGAQTPPADDDRLGLTAPELKTLIVDAALAGLLSTRDAEDLISHGLRHV